MEVTWHRYEEGVIVKQYLAIYISCININRWGEKR